MPRFWIQSSAKITASAKTSASEPQVSHQKSPYARSVSGDDDRPELVCESIQHLSPWRDVQTKDDCACQLPHVLPGAFVDLRKVNMVPYLCERRGETHADFRRQAPRPPADFGRHRSLHDDRDGPAGEPPEDAPSGQPEGGDLWGDGGRQARRHGGPRAACERVLAGPGVRRGPRNQPFCLARPHGPARRPRAIRVREERELAAHDPPRGMDRGEGETTRGKCREAPPVL